MEKGLFITFEGCDGCGKTTQINLLKDFFEKNKREVILTREPGAKGLGEKLREILLNYNGKVSDRCEEFLFLADRAQNIDEVIKPALSAGKIVLCDRHTDSTIAYQGYGRGLDIQRLKDLNNIATGGLKPDLTFIFDIDIQTSMARVGKNKDRMESAGMEFHKRVRQGYLELAKEDPDRIKVISALKTVEEIHQEILNLLANYI